MLDFGWFRVVGLWVFVIIELQEGDVRTRRRTGFFSVALGLFTSELLERICRFPASCKKLILSLSAYHLRCIVENAPLRGST